MSVPPSTSTIASMPSRSTSFCERQVGQVNLPTVVHEGQGERQAGVHVEPAPGAGDQNPLGPFEGGVEGTRLDLAAPSSSATECRTCDPVAV
jgi:hypothetical protein